MLLFVCLTWNGSNVERCVHHCVHTARQVLYLCKYYYLSSSISLKILFPWKYYFLLSIISLQELFPCKCYFLASTISMKVYFRAGYSLSNLFRSKIGMEIKVWFPSHVELDNILWLTSITFMHSFYADIWHYNVWCTKAIEGVSSMTT